MYSAIAVGFVSFLLTFCYYFDSLLMLFRFIHSFDKAVISAARYAEKFAHHCYWVFVSMAVYCLIFELWFHLLPVRRRKSRSSSTSISSCAIRLSFSSSAVIWRLRGRPFVFGGFPCLTFCSFRLWLSVSLPSEAMTITRKSEMLCYLAVRLSLSFHSEHFWLQFFYLCVLPWHNKSLLWFLLYHRRVFLSLSVFTGSVQNKN